MRKLVWEKSDTFPGLALIVSLAFCLATAPHQTWAQSSGQKSKTSAGNDSGNVDRGRYIVNGVARCGQCHTPRDANGNPEQAHALEGAAVWLVPADRAEDWPLKAPRIAGTPPGTDEEMVTLLTTGVWRDGRRLRAPMPQFRMSREDAQDVVAYLKSLTPEPQ